MNRGLASLAPDAERVYEIHVRPLERDHFGAYVVVRPDGRTILADSLTAAAQEAAKHPHPRNYIFKIGEGAVGKLR